MVPDAGILVSGAINNQGNPHRLLQFWRDGDLNLIVCPSLLSEVQDVLGRPRLSRLITVDDADVFLDALRLAADLRPDPEPVIGLVPADPDDDYVVALARETGAAYIVASGRHLLDLESPRPPVINPRDLVAEIERLRAERWC